MTAATRYVGPIHFEDFSGEAFERLVFAYIFRVESWESLEWYGQVGSDSGRDLWGLKENDYGRAETVCVQCVNRSKLTKAKAQVDIDKIVKGPHGKPTLLKFICRSNVSADLRDHIRQFAQENGIYQVEIWSGQEFEERLRASAESLLRRFCDGVIFPDAATELGPFVQDLEPVDDREILGRLNHVFDRPAFTTPFDQESNLGDFKQAISDTIEALNTGVRRVKGGAVFSKIHCRLDIKDPQTKQELSTIATLLNRLRMLFDELQRRDEINYCDSGSHFHVSPLASHKMDSSRRDILVKMRNLTCKFEDSGNG